MVYARTQANGVSMWRRSVIKKLIRRWRGKGMDKKEAIEILAQAINYKEDGSTQTGNWILSTKGIEAIKEAIKAIEELSGSAKVSTEALQEELMRLRLG